MERQEFGFGVIYKNGLLYFDEFKGNCYNSITKHKVIYGDDIANVTIEPVKVIFAVNGNIRYWTRNNRSL